jgi:hypothetical protein
LAAEAGSFLRYVDRGSKELFLTANRGVKTFFKLKTLRKKLKNPAYRYYKYSKIQRTDFTKYKQRKTLVNALYMLHLYISAIL